MKVSTRSSTTSDRNEKASDIKVSSTGHKSGSNSNAASAAVPLSSSSSGYFVFEMLPEHIDRGRKKCFKVCYLIYFIIPY